MKDRVLAFLKEKNEYCSGEEISNQIGVTRAAIWKAIKKLQADGYEIQSSTKKGYKLLVSPNIVTPNEVKEHLKTEYLGQNIHYEEKIGSTNDKAKELANLGAEEGFLVIADQQTGGKGRLGRRWESPARAGIWMSLILRPNILPQQASQITLIAGLCMCETLQGITGLKASIKWPNDIVISGKKVCGILTEMSAEMDGIKYIILGIGVNVNMTEFPEELPYASSLALESGIEYSRKAIIDDFLERFEKEYNEYKQIPYLDTIRDRYEKNCITVHKQVKLIKKSEEVVAEVIGITEDGGLKVRHVDGTIEAIVSGEVSVRGLYGYI